MKLLQYSDISTTRFTFFDVDNIQSRTNNFRFFIMVNYTMRILACTEYMNCICVIALIASDTRNFSASKKIIIINPFWYNSAFPETFICT